MSTSKHFDKLVAVVLVLGLLLTVAFIHGEALGVEKIVDEDAEQYETSSLFTANDRNGDWDTSKATATITLNGESAKISGNGAYFNDGSVVITGAGYYVFSGALTDGNIVVDAYDSSKVFLLLNGVELYCADDACLRVENAEKVFLTLAAGTENRFESGADYSETALADNTGGTIFTHDDLTVNGSGSLAIVANYKHGVDANDDLILAGGTITVTCPSDGLHVNDSFRMTETSLTIDAGDDGIHSDTDIYIESGTLLITNCYEGLEAKRIEVAGGDIMIYPTDDGFNANGGSGGFGSFGGDGGGERPDFGGEMPDFSGEMPDFDGERPDFSSMFENGEMPTPPDFDGELPEMGEQPEMGEMPEMGEQPDMGGEAANGETSDGEDEETYIRISGGNIMVINETAQDADGLDSNGDIYITGGTILVSLPGSGTNNAIDFGSESGGVAEISGGTVIACGASMMAESFDTSSTQPSILYNTSAGASAGTTVALEDADGNTLLTWDVPCSFTSMVMSCPEMKLGETYTVVIGDSAEEITLDEISASYGDAQSGGFGGSMNWGGMSPRGGSPDFGGRGDSSGEDSGSGSGEHHGKGGFPGGGFPGGKGGFPGQRGDTSDTSETGETATQTQ